MRECGLSTQPTFLDSQTPGDGVPGADMSVPILR